MSSPSDRLTPELASQFARIALGHVAREYPNKMDTVLTGPQDVKGPRAQHPIFFGSFDWHSCVHGWWTLFTVVRLYPDMDEAADIRALADAFERRFLEFLPIASYPIRTGVHSSTAFALRLAWDYPSKAGLGGIIADRAGGWYGADRDAQAWEPSLDDFLSPTLMTAGLLSHVMDRDAFTAWFDAYLPRAAAQAPATLFTPAVSPDRTDGKMAHLDGVNLSRAWCWREIAAALPVGHAVRPVAEAAARIHLAIALPHVAGDYMGEHWLASFALLALTAG